MGGEYLTLKLSEANAKVRLIVHEPKLPRELEGLRRSEVRAFNLPAGESAGGFLVCIGKGLCGSLCYAQQGRYRMPQASEPREANLAEVRRLLAQGEEVLSRALVSLVSESRARLVRLHDSGDFFSQSYLDSWLVTARALPRVVFYCYTKSLTLNWEGAPRNLRVTQSLGGRDDHLVNLEKPHARIFSSVEAREEAGYIDGDSSDLPAIVGETRIGLVYHGVRKLTKPQTLALAR